MIQAGWDEERRYRREWRRDNDWEYAPDSGRRCRYQSGHPLQYCGKPTVAAMWRGRRRIRWFYCADHLYGRRIANGRIEWLIIVEEAT